MKFSRTFGQVQSRIQKREYFDMAMDALQINDISLKRELWQSLRTPANVAAECWSKSAPAHRHQTYCGGTTIAWNCFWPMSSCRQEFLPLLGKSDYEELATASIFTGVNRAAG